MGCCKEEKKCLSVHESRVMVQVVCEQIIGKVSHVSVGVVSSAGMVQRWNVHVVVSVINE